MFEKKRFVPASLLAVGLSLIPFTAQGQSAELSTALQRLYETAETFNATVERCTAAP